MAQYTDEQLEQEILERGLTAPRVTAQSLKELVIAEQFHQFPGTTVTVCCLTLKNGFNSIGHSASASPDNFDQGIGERLARQAALDKIWPLEGYLLRQHLFESEQTQKMASAISERLQPGK